MDRKKETKIIKLKQAITQPKAISNHLKSIEIDMISIIDKIETNIKSGHAKDLVTED